jgi:hypothetical protein
MSAKNPALAITLAALAASLVAPQAHAASFTIETGNFRVKQLGPLKTSSNRTYAPTIRRAISAFGQPSNSFSNGGCVVKWKRLGLRIVFANFSGDPRGICHPDVGRAQSFTIERSQKWRTWKGLRVGMPEDRVLELHPYADWADDSRFYDQGYWLRWNYSPFGDGSEYPVLAAHLRNGYTGRVRSFSGWIGSAGE